MRTFVGRQTCRESPVWFFPSSCCAAPDRPPRRNAGPPACSAAGSSTGRSRDATTRREAPTCWTATAPVLGVAARGTSPVRNTRTPSSRRRQATTRWWSPARIPGSTSTSSSSSTPAASAMRPPAWPAGATPRLRGDRRGGLPLPEPVVLREPGGPAGLPLPGVLGGRGPPLLHGRAVRRAVDHRRMSGGHGLFRVPAGRVVRGPGAVPTGSGRGGRRGRRRRRLDALRAGRRRHRVLVTPSLVRARPPGGTHGDGSVPTGPDHPSSRLERGDQRPERRARGDDGTAARGSAPPRGRHPGAARHLEQGSE